MLTCTYILNVFNEYYLLAEIKQRAEEFVKKIIKTENKVCLKSILITVKNNTLFLKRYLRALCIYYQNLCC